MTISSMMFPLTLAFTAGFFAWLSTYAFRAHRYLAFVMATLIYVLAVAVLRFAASDDPRASSPAPFLLLSGLTAFVGFGLFMKKAPHKDVVAFVGIVTVVLMFLDLFSPRFSMYPAENIASVSADGRYTARLVYLDGMTYGYYFVCIKSNSSLEMWRGADEIAEANAEGVAAIKWMGSHRLVIQHEAGIGFVQQDRKWRDIAIDYDPLAAPKQ